MHCWCSSRLAGRDPPRLDSSTSGTGGGGAESVPERADRRLLCVPVPAGPGVPSDMPGAALVGPAAGPLRARGAALASWPTAITLLRSELEMQMKGLVRAAPLVYAGAELPAHGCVLIQALIAVHLSTDTRSNGGTVEATLSRRAVLANISCTSVLHAHLDRVEQRHSVAEAARSADETTAAFGAGCDVGIAGGRPREVNKRCSSSYPCGCSADYDAYELQTRGQARRLPPVGHSQLRALPQALLLRVPPSRECRTLMARGDAASPRQVLRCSSGAAALSALTCAV